MGHVGEIPLASLALATGFLNFWVLPLTSVGFAITSRAAAYVGSNNLQSRNTLGVSSFVSMGIFGLVVGVIFAAMAPFVTSFLTHSAEVASLASEYIQLSAIGLPGLFAFQTGSMFLTGIGRTKSVLAITALNVGVNVALEIVLVFGFHLSVAGSALGTDIAEFIGAFAIGWLLRYPGAITKLVPGVVAFAKEFLAAGIALALRTFALVGALSGSVFVASQSTPAILDSFQLGQQVWLVFGLSFDAIAVPGQVLVGEWLATNQLKAMKHWTSRLLHIGWIGGIGLAIVIIGSRGTIVGLFTNVSSITYPATQSVLFAGLVMPITAISFVIDGLVGGLQRFGVLRTVMFIALGATFAVAVILMATIGRRLTIVEIWIIFTVWLAVRALASMVAWRRLLAIQARIH
jgi:putative MATE family efflux protein